MNINRLNGCDRRLKLRPLGGLLLAMALNMPLGQVQAFSPDAVDPAIHLPPDRAVPVTTEFLARNFANAFQMALNSPGDTIALKIEGEIELPVPIPYVPPGIFNGGVQVAVTPEITVVQNATGTFYLMSLELERGLSFGASIPDMPEGTDASAKATLSAASKEIFRFSSPADAARGVMDVLLLQGLWQEMRKLDSVGIELSQVADVSRMVREYFARLTGVDFTLSRDDALRALEAARRSLQLAQQGAALASASLEEAYRVFNAASSAHTAAQQKLASAQRAVNTARSRLNACAWFCNTKRAALNVATGVLNVARRAADSARVALNSAEAGVTAARDRLDQATATLDQAGLAVQGAQRQLALLPADSAVDPFEIVLTRIVDGVERLDRSYQGFEATFTKGVALDAKASCLAAIGAGSTRSLKLVSNEIDRTIAIVVNAATERSAKAGLPTVMTSGLEMNVGAAIEYELVFAYDDATGRYRLDGPGTLKLGAALKGASSGGSRFCSGVFNYDVNVMAGLAVAPTLEFAPGRELTEFGANLEGVIDLSPVIEVVQDFPDIAPRALAEAVTSTVETLDAEQLIGAIGQVQPLPLKIAFNRVAGVRVDINGGTDAVLKGGMKLTAVWSDYGDSVDLSDMTVADFSQRVLNGGEGLVDIAETAATLIQDAYTELDAVF